MDSDIGNLWGQGGVGAGGMQDITLLSGSVQTLFRQYVGVQVTGRARANVIGLGVTDFLVGQDEPGTSILMCLQSAFPPGTPYAASIPGPGRNILVLNPTLVSFVSSPPLPTYGYLLLSCETAFDPNAVIQTIEGRTAVVPLPTLS